MEELFKFIENENLILDEKHLINFLNKAEITKKDIKSEIIKIIIATKMNYIKELISEIWKNSKNNEDSIIQKSQSMSLVAIIEFTETLLKNIEKL